MPDCTRTKREFVVVKKLAQSCMPRRQQGREGFRWVSPQSLPFYAVLSCQTKMRLQGKFSVTGVGLCHQVIWIPKIQQHILESETIGNLVKTN